MITQFLFERFFLCSVEQKMNEDETNTLLLSDFTCCRYRLCMLQAQERIHGKVVDKEEQPVDGVAVVLQTLDSTYIDAVVTDSLGVFLLNWEAGQTYRLLFQHLLYEPACKEVSAADAGSF